MKNSVRKHKIFKDNKEEFFSFLVVLLVQEKEKREERIDVPFFERGGFYL